MFNKKIKSETMSTKKVTNRPVSYKDGNKEFNTYENDEWAKEQFDKCRQDRNTRYFFSYSLTAAIIIVVILSGVDVKLSFLSAIPQIGNAVAMMQKVRKWFSSG